MLCPGSCNCCYSHICCLDGGHHILGIAPEYNKVAGSHRYCTSNLGTIYENAQFEDSENIELIAYRQDR